MIDHISLSVKNFKKSKEFYSKALRPLGYQLIKNSGKTAAFGVGGKPDFWLIGEEKRPAPTHLAFRSEDHRGVDAFHNAAVRAGGKDNGGPGPRPYDKHYYGAFVIDPEGNNVEAVCHN